MKLLADENIPYAREAFGALGEVALLAGRAIGPEQVRDCDALFVRSVTRVDAALLRGSRVRFVGTATIGTDHVDAGYLARSGVGFASAEGSNANSVAEYVVCALLCLAERRGLRLAGRRLGVVGVGNVGRRVAGFARALGMNVLLNDPPRARAEGRAGFSELEELAEADVLTLHVPLTRSGPDATEHLFDAARLGALRRDAVLINTARGAVVDNAALREALRTGALGGAVLDVWEGEPSPEPALLERVGIATPHIAGYSLDGKLNGTQQVADAACRFFGIEPAWRAQAALPASAPAELTLDASLEPQQAVRAATRALYDIEADDARMRPLLALEAAQRAQAFDRLRREYPVRREFHNCRVTAAPSAARATLAGLGFRV